MSGVCEGHACRTRQAGGGGEGGGAPGRTAGGYRLCADCHRRLALGIGLLPELYRECERVLGGAPAKGLRERTSGGPLPGAPFNAAAAEARAAILGVLGSWSGLVAQQRRIAPPPRGVAALSVFLLRHADWLAAHPAAAEATREISGLVARARRIAHPEPVRRVPLGACVEPGCTGSLSATVRAAASGTPPAAVTCDADPRHTWAGPEWTRLRRLMPSAPAAPSAPASTASAASPAASPAASTASSVASAAASTARGSADPEADRWLTAGDISRLWDTPVGTVYRLASEQRWRRRQRSGRTYYAEADAHDCFARRAQRARQG
jgi:hypothetical protein